MSKFFNQAQSVLYINKFLKFEVFYMPKTQKLTKDVEECMQKLNKKVVVGLVGGSDLTKISEQMQLDGINGLLQLHFLSSSHHTHPFHFFPTISHIQIPFQFFQTECGISVRIC